MATLKIKGIIISENNMGDFDKMVTILTPNGKIACSAKGSRRPKSQLMAGTQFLCFGEYMMFKGTNTYTLNSCETIELFYNIRTDLDKLEYASHITKIIQDVTYESQNTYKILQLYLNTLYVISETDMDLEFILSVFKIRLLCILGFKPIIDECVQCKNKEELQYFSLKDNGFKCACCAKQDTGSIQVSESTIKAIKYIVMAPAKKIYSFQISSESKKQLSIISKLYMNIKLEKEYNV
ncbi:MAG: DNA repair protein RecO [Clostridiaceae bacterium]|nr:DNA repair protein RecO [Clostridiaceae bacterium]